jgi:hypothetical protein
VLTLLVRSTYKYVHTCSSCALSMNISTDFQSFLRKQILVRRLQMYISIVTQHTDFMYQHSTAQHTIGSNAYWCILLLLSLRQAICCYAMWRMQFLHCLLLLLTIRYSTRRTQGCNMIGRGAHTTVTLYSDT